MKELKSFKDLVSPLSWLHVAPLSLLYPLIFQLSWKTYLIGLVLDSFALSVTSALNLANMKKRRPLARYYFERLDVAAVSQMSETQRVELLNDLIGFPGYWASRVFVISFVKAIPSIAYFCMVATDPGVSVFLQFLKLSFIHMLMQTYLPTAVFIESHGLASKHLGILHRELNLSEAFRKLKVPDPKKDFEFFENVALCCIWVFMLSLQMILMRTYAGRDIPLVIVLTVVSMFGLGLITRIWTLSRHYFVGGLYQIFDILKTFDPKRGTEILPLHSSPLLAHFEQIINSLTLRLRSYERELSGWIFRKAEESRYSALGEIAGLVVHDLSAPLHVMHFCTQQLTEEPERIFDPQYRAQLVSSGERALDLITALKTYLRSPGSETQKVAFGEAHKYVLKMLATQFHDKGFNGVSFVIDPALNDLQLGMARPDLIHVLMNLHVNSLENILSIKEKLPEIHIELDSKGDPSEVDILISDNGTGLSTERFEELTSFVFQDSLAMGGNAPGKGSMGLRLVRRLVERYGGHLSVDSSPRFGKGTTFRLKVKRLTSDGARKALPAMNPEVADG